jgi:UPF0716 protein FxsA
LFKLLFLLFITVPLAELYVLIQVGETIGILPTIALCVLTAALGAGLLRLQGLQTLARVRHKLDHGELPAIDLIAGAILMLSGMLLLTPGFITDCLGFLCLIPRLRLALAGAILNYHVQHGTRGDARHSVIVEGEFWEEGSRYRLHK